MTVRKQETGENTAYRLRSASRNKDSSLHMRFTCGAVAPKILAVHSTHHLRASPPCPTAHAAALHRQRIPEGTGELVVLKCDLSSMASIRAFAAQVLAQEQRIDIVVLNAAIRGCPMVRALALFAETDLHPQRRCCSSILFASVLTPRPCQQCSGTRARASRCRWLLTTMVRVPFKRWPAAVLEHVANLDQHTSCVGHCGFLQQISYSAAGHFHLMELLLPKLLAQEIPSRVIVMTCQKVPYLA